MALGTDWTDQHCPSRQWQCVIVSEDLQQCQHKIAARRITREDDCLWVHWTVFGLGRRLDEVDVGSEAVLYRAWKRVLRCLYE